MPRSLSEQRQGGRSAGEGGTPLSTWNKELSSGVAKGTPEGLTWGDEEDTSLRVRMFIFVSYVSLCLPSYLLSCFCL